MHGDLHAQKSLRVDDKKASSHMVGNSRVGDTCQVSQSSIVHRTIDWPASVNTMATQSSAMRHLRLHIGQGPPPRPRLDNGAGRTSSYARRRSRKSMGITRSWSYRRLQVSRLPVASIERSRACFSEMLALKYVHIEWL